MVRFIAAGPNKIKSWYKVKEEEGVGGGWYVSSKKDKQNDR